MKKLKKILLIDDDLAINFLHTHFLKIRDCSHEIITKINGKQAIEYLSTPIEGEYPSPEIIFLDINMPVMDGWEFIESYNQLSAIQKGKSLIIMLSTSSNPDEIKKSESMGVQKFIKKPLSEDIINDVLTQYFTENNK